MTSLIINPPFLIDASIHLYAMRQQCSNDAGLFNDLMH